LPTELQQRINEANLARDKQLISESTHPAMPPSPPYKSGASAATGAKEESVFEHLEGIDKQREMRDISQGTQAPII
jgi:hypothetical protein